MIDRGRLTCLLSATALGLLCFCGSAAASTWDVAQLNAGGTRAHLYGMACPSLTTCVAVGGNGTIATSADPTGGAGAWTVIRPAGDGHEEEFKPGSSFGGAQLKDVDCPSSGLCVAASFDGRIYSSTDPTGGAPYWKAIELTPPKTPRIHMLGISCPSPTFCAAAAYGGKIVYSTDPTGEAGDWHLLQLSEPHDFRAISCASPSLCVAVDLEGEIVATTDPTAGPAAWSTIGAPGGPERLSAIDCPSESLCVTGNAGQILTSTAPASGAGSWKAVSAGTGIPITGISCPTTTTCAAVDQNADVLVSDEPLGGAGAWSFKNVISFAAGSEGDIDGNGMFGFSCFSSGLCAGAGSNYQVITSTDPFAPDPIKAGGKRGKGPRVLITFHPAKRISPRKGGVEVTFRFRAIGRAAGFRCKTGGRLYRPCRSPFRYRTGGGAHRFKVRALGVGGQKGPPAAFHFRIGALLEPAPAGSCRAGPSPPARGCVNARLPGQARSEPSRGHRPLS